MNENVVTAAPEPARGEARRAAGPRNVQLARGGFEPVARSAQGTASTIRTAAGARVLCSPGSRSIAGPTGASTSSPDRARDEVEVREFEDLGALKGNKGDQQYELASGLELERYSTVVIWCRAFSVNFARAPLADARVGLPGPRLSRPHGRGRRLLELAINDPVALFSSRGWWCPMEQRYLRDSANSRRSSTSPTRLVVLSVDPPEVQAAFRAGLGAHFAFLSDAEGRWLPRLGLLEGTDTKHRPYRPAAFQLVPRSQDPHACTATGAGRRWKSCGVICARSRAWSAPTGTRRRH